MTAAGVPYHRADPKAEKAGPSFARELRELELRYRDESVRLLEESKRLAAEAVDAKRSAESCATWRRSLGTEPDA